MRAFLLLPFLFSCGTAPDDPEPTNGAPIVQGEGPNPPGSHDGPMGPAPGEPGGPALTPGMPSMAANSRPPSIDAAGASPVEDLTSSWSDSLSTTVTELDDENCPDADGDGYPSAIECPGLPSDRADCDDTNPEITPDTERWVPPGPFLMGSNSDHAGFDEQPVHVVHLSGYCMDRTTVSVADFSVWAEEHYDTSQSPDIYGLDSSGAPTTGRAQHPIEGIGWQAAHDYCAAMDKSLPTEAQWEKAARGGCEGGADPTACDPEDLVPYPWGGDAPSCEIANHNLSIRLPPELCASDSTALNLTPRNIGPYGHADLAGNVWEYVSDFWHPGTYGASANRSDPLGPEEGTHHVLRGGSWNTFSTNMRVANRFNDMVQGSATGIRCARATTPGRYDPVEPLDMVELSGTIRREGNRPLDGRFLYVTIFDSADADSRLELIPGRSPVSDIRMIPNGETTQAFTISVPAGRSYLLQSSLDNGTGNDRSEYISASGSGGFGSYALNPILVSRAQTGLDVVLTNPPEGGPQLSSPGPNGAP